MLPSFPVDQEEKIKRLLNEFEPERKKQNNWANLVFFLFLVAGIALLFLFLSSGGDNVIGGVIFLLVLAMLGVAVAAEMKKQFAKKFKRKFFDEIILKILPEIKYLQKSSLATHLIKDGQLFEAKGIFVNKINNVSSDDQFYGTRGETRFSFSEVEATSGSGDDKVTIFKGLFFKCELDFKVKNIKIYGKKTPAKITRLNRYNLKKVSLNGMDQFNEKFQLLTENPEDIDQLNRNFIKSLVNLEKLFGETIYISLKEGFVYMAIGTKEDYFDPNVTHQINMNQVQKIYHQIINCLMVVDIIDELNHGSPNPNLKQIDE